MGWWYTPKKPKKVEGGIKARSKRGKIGNTWWSERWISMLESFRWSNRLERGRRYARMGQVINFKLSKGHVEAKVQGSMRRPYDVAIDIEQIPDEDWNKAIAAMNSKAIFSAKLLSGDMPNNIEEAFSGRHSLFPRKGDIKSTCSCPDSANPCKHIAAVFYILAEEFDKDPFMIFTLRGRDRGKIIDKMGKMAQREKIKVRNVDGNKEKKVLDKNFWKMRANLDLLELPITRPVVDAALIKRLGEPHSWREPEDFRDVMESIYREITARAIKGAYE